MDKFLIKGVKENPDKPSEHSERKIKKCDKPTPSTNGVQWVHLRQLSTKSLSALRAVYNECLRRRHMPTAWKAATVIMLHKNPSDPSSYRPISLLNTVAKTLERIIAKRLITWSAGVPQGSVLSPLLYALYSVDITQPTEHGDGLAQYADDTAYFSSARNSYNATEQLQA
ncbi:hypothetical protein CBL_05079 [Carabus blaptoides fortunei]